MPRHIGMIIKEEREQNNFTQKELSDILILKSESTIGMWERGKSSPPIEKLTLLAKLFDCTSDYLLGLRPMRTDTIISFNDSNAYEEHKKDIFRSGLYQFYDENYKEYKRIVNNFEKILQEMLTRKDELSNIDKNFSKAFNAYYHSFDRLEEVKKAFDVLIEEIKDYLSIIEEVTYTIESDLTEEEVRTLFQEVNSEIKSFDERKRVLEIHYPTVNFNNKTKETISNIYEVYSILNMK